MRFQAEGTIKEIQNRTTNQGKPYAVFLLVEQYNTRNGPGENTFEISTFKDFNMLAQGAYVKVEGTVRSSQSPRGQWFSNLRAAVVVPMQQFQPAQQQPPQGQPQQQQPQWGQPQQQPSVQQQWGQTQRQLPQPQQQPQWGQPVNGSDDDIPF